MPSRNIKNYSADVRVKLAGYRVTGVATLHLWGGGTGTIEMAELTLPATPIPSRETLNCCINDNGMGCESIKSCVMTIEEIYSVRRIDRAGKIMHETVAYLPNTTVRWNEDDIDHSLTNRGVK